DPRTQTARRGGLSRSGGTRELTGQSLRRVTAAGGSGAGGLSSRRQPDAYGEAARRTLNSRHPRRAPGLPGAGSGPCRMAYLTRLRYSLVRVSISILSPISQNSGTGISKPVLILAGLSTLPEVSPRTAGSV